MLPLQFTGPPPVIGAPGHLQLGEEPPFSPLGLFHPGYDVRPLLGAHVPVPSSKVGMAVFLKRWTSTTQVAAAAVSELLERLIHYGPEPVPTEVLLRAHEREVSTNDQDPRDGHYCHPGRSKLGLGVTAPFLEQTWQG